MISTSRLGVLTVKQSKRLENWRQSITSRERSDTSTDSSFERTSVAACGVPKQWWVRMGLDPLFIIADKLYKEANPEINKK